MRKTVSFTRHSANIFFHLLTRCNLRCRHCYINPDQHGRNTLDMETIDRWLALFAHRHPSPNVIFLGGEPTLHPDLSVAVKRSRQLGYASVTIDTNGYLFHDILNRVTPKEVDYFSFSLDGPDPSVNDPLRGDGSFKQCTQGILAAKQHGFSVSLIYTVSRANIDHLQRMPPLLASLGVDRFFIQVIGVRGQWTEDAQRVKTLSQVNRDTWLAVIPPVAEAAARRGITVTFPKVFLDPTGVLSNVRGWLRTTTSSSPTAGSIGAPCARITPCTASTFAMTDWWRPPKSTSRTCFPCSSPKDVS